MVAIEDVGQAAEAAAGTADGAAWRAHAAGGRGPGWLGSLVLAACALPGVMPATVQAEEAPEQGVVAFKLSGYTDAQGSTSTSSTSSGDSSASNRRSVQSSRVAPTNVSAASGGGGEGSGFTLGEDKRITVTSPSLYGLVPLGRQWAVEGSLTVDTVSGASPTYYTDMSGASTMHDRRTAYDAKLTRYFERQSVALGVSRSKEDDYLSRSASLEGRWASEDQNTTWNAGLALTNDTINPYNQVVSNARKRTREWQLGVTQAVNPRDLVQLSVSRSLASGYLNDPYKLYDDRPDRRDASIVQLRWNHWTGLGALKLGYRYYQDTFRVRAHTVDVAWAIPLEGNAVFTPELRYYTQSAAAFYTDPSSDSSVYPGPSGSPSYFSNDQRLSAFGAFTVGGKVSWTLARSWTVDVKLDLYRQNTAWRLLGTGSTGLEPLTALMWQVGLAHSF